MWGYKPTPIQREGNRFVRALGYRLAAGFPACLLLQGDSTGNDGDEWYYLTMQWLAKKYPAYTFQQRVWSDATQSFSSWDYLIQTGTNGHAYATLPGAADSYISTTDKASLDITGDLEIIVKVLLDDWGVVGSKSLVSKFGEAGDRGYDFSIGYGTQTPALWWSTDGTANVQVYANAMPVLTTGQPKWFKVTLDVDNGAGGYDLKFYTCDDGESWVQLGTTIVGAAPTSIFANTCPLYLGTRGGGSDNWAGKIYKAIVKNGIDGIVVASPDMAQAFPAGVTTFNDAEGNEWTVDGTCTVGNGSPGVLVLNGSALGQAIAYSTDAARFAKQAAYEPQLVFINYGHNESSAENYQTTYEGLCTQLLTAYPNIGIVGVTQNPQQSPRTTTQINIHASTQIQIAQAMAKNNYGLVDAYRAFKEQGDYSSLVSASDGVHPTVAGSQVWANEAIKFLQPAVK